MNKYAVKISPQAYDDLDKIFSYIALKIKAPETAVALVDLIEEEILSLSIMPQRGAERKTGFYANRGYRQLFVKNYTIVYRIDESEKRVIVITVRYSPGSF